MQGCQAERINRRREKRGERKKREKGGERDARGQSSSNRAGHGVRRKERDIE